MIALEGTKPPGLSVETVLPDPNHYTKPPARLFKSPSGHFKLNGLIASLIIRGMQSQATIRYHFTPVILAVIKKTKDKRW